MRNNKKRQKTECGHIEGTPGGEGYQWSITDTSFDLLWTCDSHWKGQISKYLDAWATTWRPWRETKEKMVGQHHRRLWSAVLIYSTGVTSRKRQSEMEKYCPQQGLPERGDIVFVAEALSQVSQVSLSVCRQNANTAIFSKTKQFRAMVSIDDI